MLALVSSLGLCSLKSSNELEGSGDSGIAQVRSHVATGNSFPPPKAFEKYRDGPELRFALPAGLCAPLPAGCRVNGALQALIATVSLLSTESMALFAIRGCPSRPACLQDGRVTAVTLREVSLKDLGAGVVFSCPLEVPL